MRKFMIIIVVLVGMLFLVSLLHADNTSRESYYNDYITLKIAKCERQATMIDAKSEHIRKSAKMKNMQAKFFAKHREKLVKIMMAQNVEMKPYQVDYFLIKTFFDVHPNTVRMAVKEKE